VGGKNGIVAHHFEVPGTSEVGGAHHGEKKESIAQTGR
jgi:hypothetical protein